MHGTCPTNSICMKEIIVKDEDLRKASAEDFDAFLKVFYDAIMSHVGGKLTAEAMQQLNTPQITLVAYIQMRDEVMDGGFVQLIYNGLGGFIFMNPFAKMMRVWGITDLAKLLFDVRKLYLKHHEAIERDCNDDEFMAMFEQYPEFDDFDDAFVEHEEEWTTAVAMYVDGHIEDFAKIV